MKTRSPGPRVVVFIGVVSALSLTVTYIFGPVIGVLAALWLIMFEVNLSGARDELGISSLVVVPIFIVFALRIPHPTATQALAALGFLLGLAMCLLGIWMGRNH